MITIAYKTLFGVTGILEPMVTEKMNKDLLLNLEI